MKKRGRENVWESVANCAFNRPHMIHISSFDETFVTFNSVMTLRHSRKRDKIYLKKLFYLRNFLNLLQFYRVYLSWRFRKRLKFAVDWHRRGATLYWNTSCYHRDIETVVIFRYYQCQLTISYFIKSPPLLFFETTVADKIFHICCGRETLRRNFLTVCEINEFSSREKVLLLVNEFIFNYVHLFQVKCW